MTIPAQVQAVADEWERREGYPLAAFQKAICMQRLERGQTAHEIIKALVAMRVDMGTRR